MEFGFVLEWSGAAAAYFIVLNHDAMTRLVIHSHESGFK